MEIELAAHTNDLLGEAPVWDARAGALWWSDIEAPILHRLDAATGAVGTTALPEPLGSFALRARGGLVCAFRSGFAFLDPGRGTTEWIARPDPGNIFNDGACDPWGNFWAGTMAPEPAERTGRLFRLSRDGAVTCMADGIGIPNGLAWSPDGRRFVMADSLDRVIRVHAAEEMAATLPSGRIVVQAGPGTPDGAAMDAEGCLWSAEWEGGRIVRYGPDGEALEVVALPVRVPTSCAFGGDDLRTLYVTTSRHGLEGAGRAAGPPAAESWAGGLLRLRVAVPGLPPRVFAG